MTQQLDKFGKPMPGGKLYIYQAGTVAAPQIAYQDSALTLPVAGGAIITLDAYSRLPQFFLADGSIKVRLVDASGVEQFTQDGLIVTGASSGGGGGSPVDPTTILTTGDIKTTYGTGIVTGFVRANGRTIGSSSSSATERANADTQALFVYLWGVDANLAVSTGRGVSAAADWSANKNIALPDFRGRALAGLDDMGNSAAGRLTATYFGTAATVLGAAGGAEKATLTAPQLPSNIPFTDPGHIHPSSVNGPGTAGLTILNAGGGVGLGSLFTAPATTGITINPSGGNAHSVASPMMLATIYLKL